MKTSLVFLLLQDKLSYSRLFHRVAKTNSGVLTAVEAKEHTTADATKRIVRKLPPLLNALQDTKYKELNEHDLGLECSRIFQELAVDEHEVNYLEESTKLQSECLLWHKHRIGRVTASKFGPVSRANTKCPPQSLVRDIMSHSQFNSMKVPALHWGISIMNQLHVKLIIDKMQTLHDEFTFKRAGLFINPAYPHLGASPDGLVSCKCCGDGLVEIKCPYTHRLQDPNQYIDNKFYLQPNSDGKMQLSHEHDYYLQMQGQMSIANRNYCDFVCWTPAGMHIERIRVDRDVFDRIKLSPESFFKDVLLPHLLKGDFTAAATSEIKTSISDEAVYCWCKHSEFGKMIACDNSTCPNGEWFHFKCAQLTRKPRGNWYCSEQITTTVQ